LHIRSWQWAYRGLIPDAYLDSLSATREQRIEQRRANLAALPPHNRWWIAEQAGSAVGFAMTGRSRDLDAVAGTAEVYALYLAPEVAGQGIGRTLFAHSAADLRQRGFEQATLWVLESNQRARTFYEAAGWVPDGAKMSEARPGALLHEMRYTIMLK
jgi:ribosomal protein S18 acetylase RimI-like enzyme